MTALRAVWTLDDRGSLSYAPTSRRDLAKPGKHPDMLTRGRPKRCGTYAATLTVASRGRTRSSGTGMPLGNQALDE